MLYEHYLELTEENRDNCVDSSHSLNQGAPAYEAGDTPPDQLLRSQNVARSTERAQQRNEDPRAYTFALPLLRINNPAASTTTNVCGFLSTIELV